MASRNDWTPLGSVTVARAALGVTELGYRTIEELAENAHFIKDFNNEYDDVIEVRPWSKGSNNDPNTYYCYASRSKTGDYIPVAKITTLQGTQVKNSTNFYADTITVDLYDPSFLFAVVQGDGQNRMARIFIDTNGYRRFVFIVATLNSTEAGMDWAGAGDEVNAILPNNSLLSNSGSGEAEVVTMEATSAGNGADQPCRSSLIWTADADLHFKIGITDADANDPLLPAGIPIPMPVSNTNLLRFYSEGGGTANIIWRS